MSLTGFDEAHGHDGKAHKVTESNLQARASKEWIKPTITHVSLEKILPSLVDTLMAAL